MTLAESLTYHGVDEARRRPPGLVDRESDQSCVESVVVSPRSTCSSDASGISG